MQKEPPKAYAQMIKDEQDRLVLFYMPALRAVALRPKERLPSSVDVNDSISIGVEEMIRLSCRYGKEQNDSFRGFARKRVNGAVLGLLRSLDIMSRNNRKIIKDIDILIDEYPREYEEEPGDEYLAKKFDLNVGKTKEVCTARTISCILPVSNQLELYNEDDTLEKLEKEQFSGKIHEALEDPREHDQLIIQLYYYEELSLKEISEILGISESRISQIHKKLLKKLRERLV